MHGNCKLMCTNYRIRCNYKITSIWKWNCKIDIIIIHWPKFEQEPVHLHELFGLFAVQKGQEVEFLSERPFGQSKWIDTRRNYFPKQKWEFKERKLRIEFPFIRFLSLSLSQKQILKSVLTAGERFDLSYVEFIFSIHSFLNCIAQDCVLIICVLNVFSLFYFLFFYEVPEHGQSSIVFFCIHFFFLFKQT